MAGTAYEVCIGLEVHAQLLTKSKIFCGCPATFGADPNTMVCPVCLGLPGALPVLNRGAVTMAVAVGIALGCRIHRRSVFARKNYFYPDCPKNYQISMYDEPLMTLGGMELESDGERRRIGIERVHLEEDAGKLVHGAGGGSLVDFNRCGVPLIEIVSAPEIRSPREAGRYLTRLRQILRYIGVCDGNMEEGSLRCDVNVSLRPAGSAELGTKTEIKNLNSFKAVESGIQFEMERQTAVLRSGGRIRQVTSLWDAEEGRLVPMRSKEYAHDYRYFPEPDLPPLIVDDSTVEAARSLVPELPIERERRFATEYRLSAYDAGVLCAERAVADYFESTALSSGDPKASARWVMREVLAALKTRDTGIEGFPIDPTRLSQLIILVAEGRVSGRAAAGVFAEMLSSGEEPEALIEKLDLRQMSGEGDIDSLVDEVLAANPEEVAAYRAGKRRLFGFFVGEVMKRSGGKANPRITGEILRRRLGG